MVVLGELGGNLKLFLQRGEEERILVVVVVVHEDDELGEPLEEGVHLDHTILSEIRESRSESWDEWISDLSLKRGVAKGRNLIPERTRDRFFSFLL